VQGTLGTIYNVGLESFNPRESTYWLIWNQWCLGHLTDAELIAYLKRCGEGLVRSSRAVIHKGGVIVVKENLATEGDDVYDDLDSSVTRTDESFRTIFEEAGLKIIRTEIQKGFPKGIYPVRIYALRPVGDL
jgi:protein N-terminal methyltransferase